MSDALYPNRLRWDGLRGVAMRVGHKPVVLLTPPHLPGLEIERIDFAPYCFGTVTPRFHGPRDMERDELVAALWLLVELVP